MLLFRPDFGQPIQLRVEDVAPSSEERVYYVPADAVPSAHLRGQCLDAAGAPLPDVTIRLFQEHDVVHRGTKTQADGTFDIGPLPSGTYRIVPRHETATFEAFDRTLQAHEEVDLPPIRAR